MESLGQRVRYSEDRWGQGTWTAVEGAVVGDAGPADSQRVEPETPHESRELAVIAPDVACRVDPWRTGQVSRVLPVDYHFRTDRSDTAVAGESWVHLRPHGCWVPAALAAPADTDEHVLTIADRFVTSGEAWSFNNRVRLYTVLSSWEAHAWTVSAEAYLALYEKHRENPFAEEILWEYASESDAYSCEGDVVCKVRQAVNRLLARYWTDFPGGRHIAEAVELGRTVLGDALERCRAARAGGPESGPARDADRLIEPAGPRAFPPRASADVPDVAAAGWRDGRDGCAWGPFPGEAKIFVGRQL